jgi:hypothetical protein
MKSALFVFCGNCRTFIDCFESCYDHIISKLFDEKEYKVYIYFYLKLSDPGPKGQCGWDFSYKDVEYDTLIENINKFQEKYKLLSMEYKIIFTDEISNTDLLMQGKDITRYKGIYTNATLLRGLHCHYNFEKCGYYILQKEAELDLKFDYLIYVRPDLFFTNDCKRIESYSKHAVTLAHGPYSYNNDHLAIIPRSEIESFFFERMNVYRTNTTNDFITPEEVYWHTIKYTKDHIGIYFIKRQ